MHSVTPGRGLSIPLLLAWLFCVFLQGYCRYCAPVTADCQTTASYPNSLFQTRAGVGSPYAEKKGDQRPLTGPSLWRPFVLSPGLGGDRGPRPSGEAGWVWKDGRRRVFIQWGLGILGIA